MPWRARKLRLWQHKAQRLRIWPQRARHVQTHPKPLVHTRARRSRLFAEPYARTYSAPSRAKGANHSSGRNCIALTATLLCQPETCTDFPRSLARIAPRTTFSAVSTNRPGFTSPPSPMPLACLNSVAVEPGHVAVQCTPLPFTSCARLCENLSLIHI